MEERKLPLSGHFEELRTALFRSLIAVLVGFSITYTFSDKLIHFLEMPLLKVLPQGQDTLYFTGLTDKFFTYFQVSLYASLALVLPYILYEVWRFVSPALYPQERTFLIPFLIIATCAFFGGLAFGFFWVIPYGYNFLINFGSEREKPLITLKDYFSLTTQMLLGMGLVFELPVVVVLLAKFGLISIQTLKQMRATIYVGLSILAAVITPTPDAFTMLLTWLPLCLLYELSLLFVQYFIDPKLNKPCDQQ